MVTPAKNIAGVAHSCCIYHMQPHPRVQYLFYLCFTCNLRYSSVHYAMYGRIPQIHGDRLGCQTWPRGSQRRGEWLQFVLKVFTHWNLMRLLILRSFYSLDPDRRSGNVSCHGFAYVFKYGSNVRLSILWYSCSCYCFAFISLSFGLSTLSFSSLLCTRCCPRMNI